MLTSRNFSSFHSLFKPQFSKAHSVCFGSIDGMDASASEVVEADRTPPAVLPFISIPPQLHLDSPLKRKRAVSDLGLSQPSSSSQPISTPLSTPPSSKAPVHSVIPAIPLLYHLATTAHRASQSHLQQAFIPAEVTCDFNAGYPPMTIPDFTGQQPRAFQHDPQAAAKVIGLQVLALDLLKAGLGARELSDKERVAFGLEFVIIGLKLLNVGKVNGKGKEIEIVDMGRLETEIQQVLGESVCPPCRLS